MCTVPINTNFDLNDRHIPKGFSLKFHSGQNSGFLHHANSSVIERCSFQLMRNALRDNDNKMQILTRERLFHKEKLRISNDSKTWRNLSTKVHQLNSELYDECNSKKQKKYTSLPAIEDTNTVVKIPETIELSDNETSLLQKGLAYIPENAKVDSFETLADTERFFRKIRLQAHFAEKEEPENDERTEITNSEIPIFNKKVSNYTPPSGEYETVDSYITTCRKEIRNIDLQKRIKPTNISSDELKALKSLQSRTDIIIKPADKGGAVCVWDKDLYVAEGEKQLSDSKFYTKLQQDITPTIQKEISSEIKRMITNKELPPSAENLIMKSPRCSQFYLLPKIHKQDTPGRPVVSNCFSPTYFISKFLSQYLRPIVEKCPTYIKDTTNLLQTLDNFEFKDVTPEKHLFTMDVKGLYTNIPNSDGLKALRHFLDKRENPSISTETLARLAELVLTKNCFEFNGQFYSQSGGTMMGTPFGVEYSCLFMSFEEEKINQEYDDEKPQLHKRFIDDIFGATSMPIEKLKQYIDFVQNHHPALQCTVCIAPEVNMLDTTLSVSGNRIESTLFCKPTDKHSYLNFKSSHPNSCKQGIPYSQFLRVKRICSSKNEFEKKVEMLSHFFVKQGYPKSLVQRSLRKVRRLSRNSVLYKTKAHKEFDRTVFSIT